MNPKTRPRRKPRLSDWYWFPFVAGALYYFLWIWNPLPSDEEMIENFQAHRADFVEAVRLYRDYPRPPDKDTSLWFKDGDTLEVYKRAGIEDIDARGCWLPDPYSVETAIKDHDALLSGVSARQGWVHKCGALRIRPATTPRIDHPDRGDDQSRYYRNTLIFGVIWKDYYFFPKTPRVENGELLGPLSIVTGKFPGAELHGYKFHEKEGVATVQDKDRVLLSLNRLPSHWKGFECVYRQIEPQWFLRLCNGRH